MPKYTKIKCCHNTWTSFLVTFFTWFNQCDVHAGKLFGSLPTGMAHLRAAVVVSAPCPLPLFLGSVSAALVAAVGPQATAQCIKVKQFQFQVTLIPRAANGDGHCANSWALLQQDCESMRVRKEAGKETITAVPEWASCSEIWALRACLQAEVASISVTC